MKKKLKGKYHCKSPSKRSPTRFIFNDNTENASTVCLPGMANTLEYQFFDWGNGRPQTINIFTIDQKHN